MTEEEGGHREPARMGLTGMGERAGGRGVCSKRGGGNAERSVGVDGVGGSRKRGCGVSGTVNSGGCMTDFSS